MLEGAPLQVVMRRVVRVPIKTPLTLMRNNFTEIEEREVYASLAEIH